MSSTKGLPLQDLTTSRVSVLVLALPPTYNRYDGGGHLFWQSNIAKWLRDLATGKNSKKLLLSPFLVGGNTVNYLKVQEYSCFTWQQFYEGVTRLKNLKFEHLRTNCTLYKHKVRHDKRTAQIAVVRGIPISNLIIFILCVYHILFYIAHSIILLSVNC